MDHTVGLIHKEDSHVRYVLGVGLIVKNVLAALHRHGGGQPLAVQDKRVHRAGAPAGLVDDDSLEAGAVLGKGLDHDRACV